MSWFQSKPWDALTQLISRAGPSGRPTLMTVCSCLESAEPVSECQYDIQLVACRLIRVGWNDSPSNEGRRSWWEAVDDGDEELVEGEEAFMWICRGESALDEDVGKDEDDDEDEHEAWP